MEKYSHYVLRFGLAFVFLWFAYSEITNTQMWVRLVPAWEAQFLAPETLVIIHAVFEIIFGLLLAAGIWIRWTAILLALSLLHTLFLVSGPTLVRDIGLFAALIAIALNPRK